MTTPEDINVSIKTKTKKNKFTNGVKNAKNLQQERFGKLVARWRLDKDPGKTYRWLCKCDCGKFCKVEVNLLTRGQTTSCGCQADDNFNASARGKKNGYLKVKKRFKKTDAEGNYTIWYLCKCGCQNVTEILVDDFKKIYDCGCGVGIKYTMNKHTKESIKKINDLPIPKEGDMKTILEAHLEGKSWKDIGLDFGISKQAIQQRVKNYRLKLEKEHLI